MAVCAAAGALHTHGSLAAHVRALVDAWAWQEDDRILHALPLHHVHGVINALHCAHALGAAVEFLPKFSPADVWRCLTVRPSLAIHEGRVRLLLTAQGAGRGCELGWDPVQSVWQQVVGPDINVCTMSQLLGRLLQCNSLLIGLPCKPVVLRRLLLICTH